jgi:hypothetical protein
MLSDARHALAPAQKIALAVRALPVVQPEERGKEAVVLEKIGSLCVTVNEMFGRLEDLFQIGTDLLGEALDPRPIDWEQFAENSPQTTPISPGGKRKGSLRNSIR